MTYDLLLNKIDTLNEAQKKSVLDYVNFLIFQNSQNNSVVDNALNNDEKYRKRLEYLSSLDNKEKTSRSVNEINQYISELRNEERVF